MCWFALHTELNSQHYRLKWLQKLYTMEPRLTVTSLVSHHYACPVWERSTHAKKLDVTLNETFMKLYLNVLLTRFAFFWRVAFSWHPPVFFSSDFELNLSNDHRLSEANKYQQSARTRRNRPVRHQESGGKSYGMNMANYGQWTSRSGAKPEIAEEFY